MPKDDKPAIAAIHLDAVGGVAGDMFAAALLDARPDFWPACEQAVACLKLPEGTAARMENANHGGFAGTRFHVDEGTADDGGPSHHIPWADIRDAISHSPLTENVRHIALNIFSVLAEAEAAVHGIEVDTVTFHEVGAADSIIDVVTAAVLIDAVGPCQWSVGPLPRGRGQVRTQHGILPVPAPATAHILRGFVLVDDGEDGERITPTGAAILKHLKPSQEADPTPRVLLGTGTGFGTKELKSRANMLRATIYATASATALNDSVEVLRCEIDDQTAEDLAVAIDRLRDTEGVLDVCQWPVFGKKGRVATALQVLADPPQSEKIIVQLLNETHTLGVRRQPQLRSIVARNEIEIEGVRVKLAERPGGITAKAEMDDIAGEQSARARQALKQKAETLGLAEAKKNAD